jgi:hypothetical protein
MIRRKVILRRVLTVLFVILERISYKTPGFNGARLFGARGQPTIRSEIGFRCMWVFIPLTI